MDACVSETISCSVVNRIRSDITLLLGNDLFTVCYTSGVYFWVCAKIVSESGIIVPDLDLTSFTRKSVELLKLTNFFVGLV
jgi:hypothetical protein